MKKEKYAQLLGDSTANRATAEFNNAQLTTFSSNCVTTCKSTTASLDSMQTTLLGLGDGELSKAQADTLHSIQRAVDKSAKLLKQDFEKPALQTRKTLEKITKEIQEKILPAITGYSEQCEFKLDAIKQLIDQAQPILLACKQKLDACFIEIYKCQAKLATLDDIIHKLNLPHDIEQTTKTIEKITKDLASLNLHIATQPMGKERYQKEFLPLRAALSGLSLQTQSLVTEQMQDVPKEQNSTAAPTHKAKP